MNNYQDDLIGMFLVKPQLLDLTILKPSYFDKKHRDIFTAIKKSYKENKTIILEDILAVKGIDVDLVIAVLQVPQQLLYLNSIRIMQLRSIKRKPYFCCFFFSL